MKDPKMGRKHLDLAKTQRSLPREALSEVRETTILIVEMQIPAIMYTDSARRVLGLEYATLTRCEGEEDGAEMAAKGEMRTKKGEFRVLTS